MEVKGFFDIDGTFGHRDRKSVLKSTMDKIKIVKEQVLVGVATGRGPFLLSELMDDRSGFCGKPQWPVYLY